MRNTTFETADFVLSDGLYVSPAIQMIQANALVEIIVDGITTVTVFRGTSPERMYPVADEEVIIDTADAFNITEGTPGQYISIASIVAPTKCFILS